MKRLNGGSHFKARAPKGRQKTLAHHGAKEVGEVLRRAIIKPLGLGD